MFDLTSRSKRRCVLIVVLTLSLVSCSKRSWHYETYVIQSVGYPDGGEHAPDLLGRIRISGENLALQISPSAIAHLSNGLPNKLVGPYRVRFHFRDREDVDKLVIIHSLDIRSDRGNGYKLLGPESFPFEIPSIRRCVNPPDIGAHKGREAYCYRLYRYDFGPLFDFDFHGSEVLNVELDVEVRAHGAVVRDQVCLKFAPVLDADSEWFFNPPSA